MTPELSFAQALTEARQIIVQQSNRIKADLDRIKSAQEQIAHQTAALAELDQTVHQKATEIEELHGQARDSSAKLDEQRTGREQAEAVCDRQGQRLSQLQETLATTERTAADQAERIDQLQDELDHTRGRLPTADDHEALVALTSLLAAKKGGGPAKTIESPVALAA